MILAAGLGTRLRPMTLTKPKPLIEFMGKPLITYALDYMVEAKVKKIAINTHYLAEQIPKVIGEYYKGISIEYLFEPEILGTGGGLKNACEQVLGFEEPIFLMNSDIAVRLDVDNFLQKYETENPAVMLLLKTVLEPGFLEVAVGTQGRVQDFNALICSDLSRQKQWTQKRFCGTHILSPRVLKKLPKQKSFQIVRDFYVPLVQSGEAILSVEQEGVYFDLGTPESLEQAIRFF